MLCLYHVICLLALVRCVSAIGCWCLGLLYPGRFMPTGVWDSGLLRVKPSSNTVPLFGCWGGQFGVWRHFFFFAPLNSFLYNLFLLSRVEAFLFKKFFFVPLLGRDWGQETLVFRPVYKTCETFLGGNGLVKCSVYRNHALQMLLMKLLMLAWCSNTSMNPNLPLSAVP